MVALGMFFIGLTALGAFFWWRGKLFKTRWLLWVFVFSVAGPYIANQFGWAAAEVGRQPWIVYGLLRTADAFSPVVSRGQILGSMVMFSLIYLALFVIWLYVMNMKIQKGPLVRPEPAGRPEGGWKEAVARGADPAGPTLTGDGEADSGPPERQE
jgi:cytochrome d ubiquinol oxidase subunit I